VATIIARRRWARQPRNASYATLDDRFPVSLLWSGTDESSVWMRGGVPGNSGADTRMGWTYSNTGSYAGTPEGVGRLYSGSQASAVAFASNWGSYPFTVGVVFALNSVTTCIAGGIVDTTNSSGNVLALIGVNGSGQVYAIWRSQNAGTLSQPAGPSAKVNTPYRAALHVRSRNDTRLFVNGVKYTDSTDCGAFTASFYGGFSIGGQAYAGGLNNAMTGTVSLAWSDHQNTYEDAQLLDWTVNPWVMFRPRAARMYFGVTAAGALPYSRGRVINRGGLGDGYSRGHVVN